MTLHVFSEENGKKRLLLGLEFDSLQQLEPVFRSFQSATGVRLSEYDDATLGPQHLTLLDQLLAKALSGGVKGDQAIFRFTVAVHHAASSDHCLIFVGE